MLEINARDVEDSDDIPLQKAGGLWSLADRETARQSARSETRQKIIEAVREGAHSPAEIAAATELDRGSVSQQLLRMCKAGDLLKMGRGRYAIPSTIPEEDRSTEESE